MTGRRITDHGNGLSAVLMIFCMVALPAFQGCSPSSERTSSFKTIFDRYREREGIVAVSFPPGLVGLLLNENDPGQAELKSLFGELSTFRMLSIGEGAPDRSLFDEIRKDVTGFTQGNDFADMFRMQTADEELFIRVREKDGKIREAVLMFGTPEDFLVVNLRGNIDPAHLVRLKEGGGLESFAGLADISP